MTDIGSILLRFISLILGIEQMQSFPPPLSKDEEAEMFKRMRGGDMRAREREILFHRCHIGAKGIEK